jgi:ABC-2 type transport system permease protein
LIEIGIYSGDKAARPLYLKKHRIRSDQNTITLTVAGKPVRAGIDPNFLLIDQKPADNTREIKLLD